MYFIPCGANPECQQEGQIVKQADDLLGWKTVIAPNDGSPQQSKAAFDQVVRAKADAVLYTAIPLSTFASEVPALKANGTVVATCCVTDPTGNWDRLRDRCPRPGRTGWWRPGRVCRGRLEVQERRLGGRQHSGLRHPEPTG